MKVLKGLLCSMRGRVGLTLLLAGSAVFLIRLYLALLFYVASERILYHLPSIAPLVTLAELVDQPDVYAGKWVRVRVEVWQRSEHEAMLVPPGSGPEPAGTKTNIALLPKDHLYTHSFGSDGVTSVSVLDLPANQAVTLAGEFEAATATFVQHIDAASFLDPRPLQHDFAMHKRLVLHASWLVTSGLIGLFGFYLMFSAWFEIRTQTLPSQR